MLPDLTYANWQLHSKLQLEMQARLHSDLAAM